MQDEIAAAVVDALKLKLLPADRPSNAGHHVPGPEAYHHFLLGRQFLNRATDDGFKRAVTEYGQAVALEPGYAAALTGLALAEAYASDDTVNDAEMHAMRARANRIAEQAVASDPQLGEAYTTRAVLRFVFERDWAGADTDFARAVALNPGDVMTRWQHSRLLAALGRLHEALVAASLATELDPLSAQAWEVRSRYEIALDQQAQARRSLQRALDIAPEHGRAPVGLGLLALLQGDAASARDWFARTDNITFRQMGLAMAAHDLGELALAQQTLDALIAADAHHAAYQIAGVHAWRGANDDAFDWLERALVQSDAGLQYLKYDPALRSLRGDPRYLQLLQRLGLPA